MYRCAACGGNHKALHSHYCHKVFRIKRPNDSAADFEKRVSEFQRTQIEKQKQNQSFALKFPAKPHMPPAKVAQPQARLLSIATKLSLKINQCLYTKLLYQINISEVRLVLCPFYCHVSILALKSFRRCLTGRLTIYILCPVISTR